LEAALRLLRRKIRNRWLFSNDELQFRDQIYDEESVRTQRASPSAARQLFSSGSLFGEKGPDEL